MKYDKITDHYAAALEIGKSPEYAARLDIADLSKCLEIARYEVLKAVQVHTDTSWSWSELNDEEFYSVFQRAIHEIKDTSVLAFVKAMNLIPSEIERREYDSERMEQAAEMLEYMEQVRKEREREKSPDGLNITAKDVVLFYKFFPFEDTERHGMGLYKIWAARHGFKNFHSLRNKWSQLQNVKAEGLDRVKVIGPEKVEYLAKLLTEPHHEKTREQILLFVAQYRKEHQKRGP